MAKDKNLKIRNITSIEKYLAIFSGIFRLTDAERSILSEIIRYQLKARMAGDHADPFSAAAKRVVCQRLGIANPYSINTYLGRLRKKGAVIKTQEGNDIVHPWLLPRGEKSIVIELEWKLKLD